MLSNNTIFITQICRLHKHERMRHKWCAIKVFPILQHDVSIAKYWIKYSCQLWPKLWHFHICLKEIYLLAVTIYEAPPTCWNRSSHHLLAARRLESGIGCTLKYWLHKNINIIVRQRPLKLCLSFQHCAVTIVWHVYTLYPISRQEAVASRLLYRFSLQMVSYIVTAIKYIWTVQPAQWTDSVNVLWETQWNWRMH